MIINIVETMVIAAEKTWNVAENIAVIAVSVKIIRKYLNYKFLLILFDTILFC